MVWQSHLYVDLIVCRSVNGSIKSKPHNKYPAIHREPAESSDWGLVDLTGALAAWRNMRASLSPDAVAGPAVTPAALHLPEACDAALFPPQTAARPVDELHTRFRIHREVQEQTHHLSVRQNGRLSRTCVKHTHKATASYLIQGLSLNLLHAFCLWLIV